MSYFAVTKYEYDKTGNIIWVSLPVSGAAQKLSYDARGNIAGVEDRNRNRTQYLLDAWGRIVGVVKADGSTGFYSYACS